MGVLLPILESILPAIVQAILDGLKSHPQAQSEEIQAKIAKHEAVAAALKA